MNFRLSEFLSRGDRIAGKVNLLFSCYPLNKNTKFVYYQFKLAFSLFIKIALKARSLNMAMNKGGEKEYIS